MKAIVVRARISLWANSIHALEKLGLTKTIRSAIGHDDGTAGLYGHLSHDGAAAKGWGARDRYADMCRAEGVRLLADTHLNRAAVASPIDPYANLQTFCSNQNHNT